ncbi:unnamed protein product, partial [Ectocarpus sp. 8 AP-2014]
NCACDPSSDDLCTADDLICCIERDVCDELGDVVNGGNACVAAPMETCVDTTTSSATGCLPSGVTCASGDVTVESLSNTDAPNDSCDGSQETVTFTGDLSFDTQADRYDVGLFLGPFEDETCN